MTFFIDFCFYDLFCIFYVQIPDNEKSKNIKNASMNLQRLSLPCIYTSLRYLLILSYLIFFLAFLLLKNNMTQQLLSEARVSYRQQLPTFFPDYEYTTSYHLRNLRLFTSSFFCVVTFYLYSSYEDFSCLSYYCSFTFF